MIQFYGMQLTYQYAKQGEQGGNFGLEVGLEDSANAPELFKAEFETYYVGKPTAFARMQELVAAKLAQCPGNDFVEEWAWLAGLTGEIPAGAARKIEAERARVNAPAPKVSQARVDEQMRGAGFGSGSAIVDRFNGFNGEDF